MSPEAYWYVWTCFGVFTRWAAPHLKNIWRLSPYKNRPIQSYFTLKLVFPLYQNWVSTSPLQYLHSSSIYNQTDCVFYSFRLLYRCTPVVFCTRHHQLNFNLNHDEAIFSYFCVFTLPFVLRSSISENIVFESQSKQIAFDHNKCIGEGIGGKGAWCDIC